MPKLQWRTGRTVDEAREMMQAQLQKSGYGDQVKWDGNQFTASIAMGYMLDVSGYVNDEEVVVEKCGGMSGDMVLAKLNKMFEYLFPAGVKAA